ncbi:MAG: hypothetical protein DHS20C05_11920 [Hyphococcus sp.]|nr:MAG: hypothetical protein DHS20C05_11920 [Marinicaulis sp.]
MFGQFKNLEFKPVLLVSVTALCYFAAEAAMALERAADPEVITIDHLSVSDAVHVMRINSRVGNTNSVLILGDEKSLLVDPNFHGSAESLRHALDEIGVGPIDYLAVSHVHMDHVEQIPDFMSDKTTLYVSTLQRQNLIESNILPETVGRTQEIKKLTLDLGNLSVIIEELPVESGHTVGDIFVRVPEKNVAYVGDYLFTHGWPIIDRQLGSLDGYVQNQRYILSTLSESDRVIGGHFSISPGAMPIMSKQDYKDRVDLTVASACAVKAMQKKGYSQEAITEASLGEEFNILREDAVFVREARWIEYVYGVDVSFCG